MKNSGSNPRVFSFFGKQNNPFQLLNTENWAPQEGMMSRLPQAFVLQMQLIQNMGMMPIHMTRCMLSALKQGGFDTAPGKAANAESGGFKLGGVEIPPELLGTLLSMDMGPKKLEKLQETLDTVLKVIPKAKNEYRG